MRHLPHRLLSLALLLALTLGVATKAEAAVLRMRPAQADVTVGNIVSVQVTVDTLGKTINNAESIVQFPADLLEVVSIDNKSSIFSLWVESPTFSNAVGQAAFNGGVPNPGFKGSSGTVVSIVFRAKKAGTASLLFSNAAVRENDGLGTDILTGSIGSELTIRSVQAPPAIEPSFVLTSTSHPNQNTWYAKDDVVVSWTLPRSASAVRTLLDTQRTSEPTVYYGSPITSRNLPDLEDGIWYFHASYLADGVWSRPQHYRLQIDTTNPTSVTVRSEETVAGRVELELKAEDALSGIDRFVVTSGADKPLSVKADVNGGATAELPFSRAGQHTVSVAAYDKAGNKTETQTTVVASEAPALRIDSYPATIRVNESIEIAGTAPYPYAALRVSLQSEDDVVQVYTLKSTSYSTFTFISQPVQTEGEYTLWVDLLRDSGEVALTSPKITVVVETPLLLQIGSYTIGLMKVLIPAVLLLLLFLFILLYGWLKLFRLYGAVRKERREAERASERAFKVLREGVARHLAQSSKNKRSLGKDETEFLEELSKKLEEAEEIITKEIRDIPH